MLIKKFIFSLWGNISGPFKSIRQYSTWAPALKLTRYGTDGQLLLSFSNFLTDQKQRVLICWSYSEWSPVISGVSQGPILEPIIFLIFVNDIPNIVTSTAKLFADNTKSYQPTDKWCGRLHYPTVRSNHRRFLGGLLAGEIQSYQMCGHENLTK